ncbi:MAG: dTDP-glucose 4,6-dehydratase [Thermodesulfovibrio sp.]|nr:dTDP-glucose 4,6-dehydratase [Thermodesulfovibrio sp.]
MKILVTGGAGFIGSFFVRKALSQGYEVCVVDKLTYAGDLRRIEDLLNKIKFYKADITNKEFLEYIFSKEKPQSVIHFAAETHVDRSILDPFLFLRTNIEGTYNLLEISLRFEVNCFLNITTDEVYGEISEGNFTEESPLKPNSPYAVSKASQDLLGRAFSRTYGLPVITVRPSNNYGPWQYPEKLIPVAIAKALLEEPIPLYGDGSNIREWLYVEDCAEAILLILERGKDKEIYNIGSGVEKRNIEVVRSILKVLKKSENLICFVKDRPGHDYRYSLDSSKAEKELNWKPRFSFEEALEHTIKWYVEHQDWLFEKVGYLKEYWKRVYG